MPKSYLERSELCTNPVAKLLLKTMEAKKTNLCVSADHTTKEEVLALAKAVGPHICVLKVHADIIKNFDAKFIEQLKHLSCQHNFLIFEDRKFADIGNTAMLQYSGGIHRIADWAKITNAHTVAGPGTIEGLKQVGLQKGNALLLLGEMSSKGNLAVGDYTVKTVEMATKYKDFVIGFITQSQLSLEPTLINFTPGVQFSEGKDTLGQQYTTPQNAVTKNGTDVIIVGRGIYSELDPALAAKKYQQAGWEAYLQRLQQLEPRQMLRSAL